MRWLIVLSFLLFSSGTFAFDGDAMIQQYDQTRPGCRQSELNGQAISADQSDAICEKLAKLAAELKANNYCWNADEQEWAVCK